jgi:hypothetical protein
MPKRDIRTTIALDGEKEYKASLNDAMQAVKLLGLEVKENTTTYGKNSDSIKGNRELVSLLQKEIAKQEEIVASLTEKIAQSAEAYGDNSKQTQDYQEKLIKARTALAAMNNELDGANSRMPSLGKSIKETASNLGSGLATAAKAAATATGAAMSAIGTACVSAGKAILSLVNDTAEYRKSMSMLEQNSADAGVAFDSVKEKMIEVGAVTGDTDAAVEALSNLLASGFDEGGLTSAVDALTGAVIKFPDTLKIESLADGLQETIATGASAGAFAELIERMGGDVEAFNEQLAACTTESQRQQVALDWLAKSGLTEVANSYRETNAASLTAQEASLRMNDALASLASVVEPAVASIKGGLSNVVTAFVGMVTGAEGASDDFKKSIKDLIDNVVNMINEWLPVVLDLGMEVLISLTEGLLDAIPKLTAALPKIVNTLLTFLTNNLPQIIESGIQIIVALAQGIIAAIPNLVAKLPQIIAALIKGLATGIAEMAKIGLQLIQGLWEGIKNSFEWIKDKITGWVGDVWAFIKRLFGISSPSKYGKEIGVNVGMSIGMGITGSKGSVQSAIDDLLPTTQPLQLRISRTIATQAVLTTPAYNSRSASSGAAGDLSDATINKLASGIVSAIRKSGMADSSVVLDGRAIGRYMRRGMEVGFV